MNKQKENIIERPPVVVVMGHIDHGKSTLLDYIRKSNVVAKEAGGITQHISAYEVNHKDPNGNLKKITFLDTPGHEAFSAMRSRGARVADIAILVVSAEDSVKAQTIEAWKTIVESGIPFIVAINKIDKPGANVEKTRMDLAEKGIYLEGYGGDIPSAEISAKVGTGIDKLLELVLLVAELGELKGDTMLPATGVVIESHLDPKRGISISAVIKNGSIKKGNCAVAGDAIAGIKIMDNFLGEPINEATFSSPIKITGFDKVPAVGSEVHVFENKKEAENYLKENKVQAVNTNNSRYTTNAKQIPVIIKADVLGTVEAIEKEILKLNTDQVEIKILSKGVGAIGESDVKLASSDKDALIIGFGVKVDNSARDANEKVGTPIEIFNVIYKITDWLKVAMEERRPKKEIEQGAGKLKILKKFSETKERQVVGGKVIEGKIAEGGLVKILRRDFEIGRGKIFGLEKNKVKSKEVEEGSECGVLVETKTEIAPGDVLEYIVTIID